MKNTAHKIKTSGIPLWSHGTRWLRKVSLQAVKTGQITQHQKSFPPRKMKVCRAGGHNSAANCSNANCFFLPQQENKSRPVFGFVAIRSRKNFVFFNLFASAKLDFPICWSNEIGNWSPSSFGEFTWNLKQTAWDHRTMHCWQQEACFQICALLQNSLPGSVFRQCLGTFLDIQSSCPVNARGLLAAQVCESEEDTKDKKFNFLSSKWMTEATYILPSWGEHYSRIVCTHVLQVFPWLFTGLRHVLSIL